MTAAIVHILALLCLAAGFILPFVSPASDRIEHLDAYLQLAAHALPFLATALLEAGLKLTKRSVRNQLRELVETAVVEGSAEAAASASTRIASAEQQWGILDLWREKEALDAAVRRHRSQFTV